jgi:hypothetical protein
VSILLLSELSLLLVLPKQRIKTIEHEVLKQDSKMNLLSDKVMDMKMEFTLSGNQYRRPARQNREVSKSTMSCSSLIVYDLFVASSFLSKIVSESILQIWLSLDFMSLSLRVNFDYKWT